MSDFDWSELHIQDLREDPDFDIKIPIDPLPGEEDEDTFFRYLRLEGILTGEDEDDLFVDYERANEVDPNIARFLMACQLGDIDNVLHDLEEQGLLYSTIDNDGEFVWGLTEKGKQSVEDLHSENN